MAGYSQCGNAAAGQAQQRAADESDPPPGPGHPHGGGEGGQCRSQEHGRDGEGGPLRGRGEVSTRQPADGHDDHRDNLEQRLGAGQQEHLPMHGVAGHGDASWIGWVP
ncbi:hypothetical protein G6F65_012334 [Rhizopus arrhizus]|nr:hypothetical protein G6F23_013514 [Rhizopus arrhizus]KAG1271533.1 hypothetical protein G6F65_012334 [Rhizopus arrhizus]